MALRKSLVCLAALYISTTSSAAVATKSHAAAQVASSSTTEAPSSSITRSPDKTATNFQMSLLSVANSLITKYYPSTTITQVASLSWPGTVVVGTKTYTNVHHPGPTNDAKKTETNPPETKSTSDAVATGSSSQTKQSTTETPHDQGGDKKIAIIIGVVIGAVAVAIMGVVFFCLWRRKRASGSFFMRRSTPSPLSRMLSNRSWRAPYPGDENFGTSSYITAGAANMQEKQPRVSTIPRRNTPPITAHPAFMQGSSRSISDDNPFYTPEERSMHSTAPLHHHHEIDGKEIEHAELEHDEPAMRRSSSSNYQESRPPTPFSPMMMQQSMPAPSSRPQLHVNPFSSSEDAEADDIVSPILPSRSPERRHSPMIHYPSWSEVSDFNFSGEERERRGEEGGDRWRHDRQRMTGRYEMA